MFDGVIFVKCKNCQARNRLQVRHLTAGPGCGQCHAPLLESEMATFVEAATLASPRWLPAERSHAKTRRKGIERATRQ